MRLDHHQHFDMAYHTAHAQLIKRGISVMCERMWEFDGANLYYISIIINMLNLTLIISSNY